MIFADSIENIPFDWSGQFGCVSHNGTILWNKDWSSNQLFFDGTWAIFPRMYGPVVDKGFNQPMDDLHHKKDSSNVKSNFKYDQGDYLLDRFSFGLDYKTNSRNASLHGFKRSYVGNFNQYNNYSFQPQQQTYLISYRSSNDKDTGGFSLGHFNTYSGLPDSTDNGIFDNRITSTNIFWNRSYDKLDTRITMDHFLQRYSVKHLLSEYLGTRFLTRSRYQGEIIWKINDSKRTSISIESSNRSIRTDSLYNFQWNKLSFVYSTSVLNIYSSYLLYKNEFLFNYGMRLDKKVGIIHAYLDFRSNHYPTHPYYTIINTFDNIPSHVNNISVSGSIMLAYENNQISTTVVQSKDDNTFWETIISDSIHKIKAHRMIDLNYKTSSIPFLSIEANYRLQEPMTFYSDGIGSWIRLKIGSSLNLFNDYMLIDANIDFNRLEDRHNSSLINFVEMVPMVNYEKNNLTPVDVINAKISAHVSTFTISYEWFNLNEIVMASMSSDKNNFFKIHPFLPSLGRQVNLSIDWQFQD